MHAYMYIHMHIVYLYLHTYTIIHVCADVRVSMCVYAYIIIYVCAHLSKYIQMEVQVCNSACKHQIQSSSIIFKKKSFIRSMEASRISVITGVSGFIRMESFAGRKYWMDAVRRSMDSVRGTVGSHPRQKTTEP